MVIKTQVFELERPNLGSFWWQNSHNWFTSSNPLCNGHHVQRLWLSTLKIRAVGSYKHGNLVKCGIKFWAALIPGTSFNLSSKVNKREHYWRQQSLWDGTKGGKKSKSCWEFLGALQKWRGRKKWGLSKKNDRHFTQETGIIGAEGSSVFLLRNQPKTLQNNFSEGNVEQHSRNNLGRGHQQAKKPFGNASRASSFHTLSKSKHSKIFAFLLDTLKW